MPEEFYTLSGLTVITPENGMVWAKAMQKTSIHFVEFMSGSRRLSLGMLIARLRIFFPFDFRYGWDLKSQPHRKLADEILHMLNHFIEFSAPRCSPWSLNQNNTKPEKLRESRANETPTLK